MSRPTVDPAIIASYETARGDQAGFGVSARESLQTRELISRRVPKPPAKIIQVGGAGAYAFWVWTSAMRSEWLMPLQSRCRVGQ